MEVKRKTAAVRLRRCYQCCRHEEQIWVLAYEQIYPLARRLPVCRSSENAARGVRRTTARRA
jgi:hypothetical protein